MKGYWILALWAAVFGVLAQPSCLIEEPLTNQCIESLELSMVEQTLTKYICTIAYERRLYMKAEQFCRQATVIDYQSGYKYLKTLLLNGKFSSALKVDYMLFFTNPFDHNTYLTDSITQISNDLTKLQASFGLTSKLDNLQKAVYYFYTNKLDKSLQILNAFLKQNKDSKQLVYEHFLKVRILQIQYKYYQALEYITNVLKNNEVIHPYFYHIKGNFFMHHIQFQKAIFEFEKSNNQFHKVYKTNGFSFSNYNIGLCYQKLSQIQKAIKHYEKSIINLSSADALNALGHAHYTLYEKSKNIKDLQSAQRYYKKALQINPEYYIAVFNLGMLQLSLNKFEQAKGLFQKCQLKYRSCQYGLIKVYYSTKDRENIEKIIQSIEKNQETITDLAAILYEMEDYQRALTLFQKKDYKTSELYERKGFNQYALDKFQQAQKSFARAIFLGSKKGYVYFSLGLSQLNLKKYQECVRSFDHAYRLDPRKETKQQLQKCRKLSSNNQL